ncbi:MAG: metalloregulator ArsR/SmtB family transcription factor [Actinomycetota bacterium]|nr:metalloregulator ArsR/SmtB family transcription factor [Actinomycetota bacterium]
MDNLKNTTKLLKAMADEGRLRIVLLLMAKKNFCVCEIKEVIGLSQPTISSHLKVLQNAGILESSKDGLWVNYRLARDMDKNARQIIEHIYDSVKEDAAVRQDIKKITDVDRHRICKG